MHRLTILIIITFLLNSCSAETNAEKYFANCVKDALKFYKGFKEQDGVDVCTEDKVKNLDEFNYYKGKIYTKKR